MPYAIRLPDGTLVENIPDSVTPQQAKQRILDRRPDLMGQTKPPVEGGFLSNVGNLLVEGGKSALSAAEISPAVISGGVDKDQAATIAKELGRTRVEPKALKKAQAAFEDEGADFKKAEGFVESLGPIARTIGEVGRQALSNPEGLIYLTAQNAANIAPSIVGMLGGAKLGGMAGTAVAPGPGTVVGTIGGGIAGGFAGSAPLEIGMEFTGRVGQELQRRGLQPTEANVAKLLEDKKFVEQAVSDARTKGSTTAAIDAAFTLGAGRFATAPGRAALRDAAGELGGAADAVQIATRADELLKARTLTQKVGRGAGAVGIDVAGGGLSEAGGQLAAYGEVDLADVGLEMLGELGGSAVEIPAAMRALREPRPVAPVVPPIPDVEPADADVGPVDTELETPQPGAATPPTGRFSDADLAATGVDIPPASLPLIRSLTVGKTREELQGFIAENPEYFENDSAGARVIRSLVAEPVRQPDQIVVEPPAPGVGAVSTPQRAEVNVPTAGPIPVAGPVAGPAAIPAPAPTPAITETPSGITPPKAIEAETQRPQAPRVPVPPKQVDRFGELRPGPLDQDQAPPRLSDDELIELGLPTEARKPREPKEPKAPTIRPIENPANIGGDASFTWKPGDTPPTIPVVSGGTPFRSRREAEAARRLQPAMRLLKVPNGFLLTPKTDAQMDAQARMGRRLGMASTGEKGTPRSAMEFIAEKGGIDPRFKKETIYPDRNPRVGNRFLFAAPGKGLSLGQMSEALQQEGYIDIDDIGLALDAINRGTYTAEGYERLAEAERDRLEQEYKKSELLDEATAEWAEELGYDASDLIDAGLLETTDKVKAEVEEMLRRAEALGIHEDDVFQKAIDDAYTKAGLQGRAKPTQYEIYVTARKELQSVLERGAEDRIEDTGQPSAARDELKLTPPSPETFQAEEERAKQAAAEEARAAEEAEKAKAEADKERKRKEIEQRSAGAAEDFKLGQSAEENLTGQKDIFAQPQELQISPEKEKEQALKWFSSTLATATTPFNAQHKNRTTKLRPKPLSSKQKSELEKLAGEAIDLGLPASALYLVKDAGATGMSGHAAMTQGGSFLLSKGWASASEPEKLSAFIHELAHAIDFQIGPQLANGKKFSDEAQWSAAHDELKGWYDKNPFLNPLAYPFAKEFAGKVRPKMESLAQAAALYFTAPVRLQNNAPQAYSQIQSIFERIENESKATSTTGAAKASPSGVQVQPSRTEKSSAVQPAAGKIGTGVSKVARGKDRAAEKLSASKSIRANADKIAAMDPDKRDNTELGDFPGSAQAYNLYEARKMLKKPSDKLKKVTTDNSFSLWQEWDFIANVDGELYGVTKDEDPDDVDNEEAFVYVYAPLDNPNELTTTVTSDAQELFSQIRQDQKATGDAVETNRSEQVTGDTIEVDGKERPTRNADGRLIESTPEKLRNFWRFFGDSLVVDKDGRPMVVYHGTRGSFDAFKRGPAGIFFSSNPLVANKFAADDMLDIGVSSEISDGANVIPAYISMKKPFDASKKSDVAKVVAELEDRRDIARFKEGASKLDWKSLEDFSDFIEQAGFDGYFVKEFGEKNIVVFDPKQIKSATGNIGAYGDVQEINMMQSPVQDPDALKGEGKKAVENSRESILYQPIDGTWNTPMDPKPLKLSDEFFYNWVDKQVDLKRVVDAIGATGKRIAGKFNALERERTYHGRVADRTNKYLTEELQPTLDLMQKYGITQREIGEYLLNRHAPEANKVIAERNPRFPDAGSSVTTADAINYMNSLDPLRKRQLDAVAKRMDKTLTKMQDMLIKYGIETQDTIDGWRDMFQYYIPLVRMDGDYSINKVMSQGAGYSRSGDTTKSRTGSSKEVNLDEIFSNIAMQHERMIVRAEGNRIGQALFGLALTEPNPGFWLALDPDTNVIWKTIKELEDIKASRDLLKEMIDSGELTPSQEAEYRMELDLIRRIIKKKEQPARAAFAKARDDLMKDLEFSREDATELVQQLMMPPMKARYNKEKNEVVYEPNAAVNNEFVFATRINGSDKFVLFNGNDERANRMVRGLKSMDAENLSEAMNLAATITRFFAAINTQYNPVFGAYNFLRDVQTAALQISTTEIADKRSEVINGTPAALKAIFQVARARRDGKKVKGELAADFAEFESEGGQTGFRNLYSQSEERAKAIQRQIDPSSWADSKLGNFFTAGGTLKVPFETMRKGAAPLFNFLSDYNQALENAVRLSAYRVAREKFKSQGMSLADAKQKAATIAKDITVNFNQKGVKATQMGALYAFFNASVQGTAMMGRTLAGPLGRKIIAGGMLWGVMQTIFLAMAGFDDEEPPEFVKQRNFIIPYGLIVPGAEGKYLAFPMPLGFNVIPTLSRLATEAVISGGENVSGKAVNALDAVMDMFNPIGNAGLSLQTIAPTLLDPLAALFENKSWTGQSIAREDFSALNPTPGFTRSRDSANVLSQELARFLNAVSGGNEARKGLISPTADQLEYLAGQLTGGVGRETIKGIKSVEALITGEELPSYSVPLVGRFHGNVNEMAAVSSAFYRNLTELNIQKNEIKNLRENKGDVQAYLAENPEARLAQMATAQYNQIKNLRKLRQAALEKGDKERAKKLEEAIKKRMVNLNERYQKAVE